MTGVQYIYLLVLV